MPIKKIIEKTYVTILWFIFLSIISYITIKFFIPKIIWMVGDFPYPTDYYSLKKVLIVVLSTIFLLVLLFLYYKWVILKLNKTFTNIVIFTFIVLILISEAIISLIAFNPVVGDYAIIKDAIRAFFENKEENMDMGQFYAYPYNTHIKLIGGYLSKLLGSVDIAVSALPIFTITGSIILNTLIIKKVTNYKAAQISIVMAFLNILIYWQAPVFYTHTLVVIFLPATIYAYLNLKSADSSRKRVIWWIVFAFFAACTYIIRPTALSVAIAIFIDQLFIYRKKISFKIISSFILCLFLIISFKSITTTLNLSTDNSVEKIPYSHWIKMGLNEQTYGVWNTEDVTYPSNINNTQERDDYNKEIIIQRLKDFGLIGYLKHLDEKVERLWVSSQFSSYRLGEWFEQKNNIITNIVSNYTTFPNKIFSLYSYIIKFIMFLGTLTAIILYWRLNESESEILRICLISTFIVFVFLLLWETAPHYTYEAFALLNIPATIGFYKLFNYMPTRFKW